MNEIGYVSGAKSRTIAPSTISGPERALEIIERRIQVANTSIRASLRRLENVSSSLYQEPTAASEKSLDMADHVTGSLPAINNRLDEQEMIARNIEAIVARLETL